MRHLTRHALVASTTAFTALTAAGAAAAVATSPTTAAVSAPTVASSAVGPTGLFTILLGRTQYQSADRLCEPLRNTITLSRVQTLLRDRGKVASGNVVVKRTGQSRSCFQNYVISPSWNDLTQMRQDGWQFTSAGMNYQNMTSLTPTEQHAESCGSVGALQRRGHTRAWGLFAYPNNKYSDTIQQQVVRKCFAFGRKYGDGLTTKANATTWPNWQSTLSVNGGRCADTSLPCGQTGAATVYMKPSELAPLTKATAGTWRTMQWYRFVTGTSTPGTSMQWNCTGPIEQHWTSDAELYCISDFLRVVDAIPDTVTVTDPATVATMWGVAPTNPRVPMGG